MLPFFCQKLLSSMFRSSKRKPYRKARRAPLGRRSVLQVESLEERLVPATFVDAGTTLTLVLGSNESLSSIATDYNGTGGSYSLVLGGNATWSGINDAKVSGDGTNTLAVTPGVFTTDISITGIGGNSATFADSGSNVYSDPITINFTGAASTAVTFNGESKLNGGISATADGAIDVSSGALVFGGGSGTTLSLTGEASSGDGITIAGGLSQTGAGAISLTTSTSGDIAIDFLTLTDSGEINIISAGAITEGAAVDLETTTGTVTTSSANGTTLTGINLVSNFNATDNSSAGISLDTTNENLTITGISESGTGAVDIQTVGANSRSITTSGAITAPSSAVTLTATNGALSIGAGIDASAAGSVTLSNTGPGNDLTINGVINSNNAVTATSAGNIHIEQNVTGSSVSFQADSGGAGGKSVTFTGSPVITAASQTYRAGNGSTTTSSVNFANAGFNGPSGIGSLTSFTDEQDASITDADLPASAAFSTGMPINYNIISDGGDVEVDTPSNVFGTIFSMTSNAPGGIATLGNSSADFSFSKLNVTASSIILNSPSITSTATSGTTQTYNGPVTLAQSTELDATNGGLVTGDITITGGVTNDAASGTVTLQINDGTSSESSGSSIGGGITDGVNATTALILEAGVLTLNGASTYSGLTTVNSATYLVVGVPNATSSNSSISLNGTLDLNGNSTTVGGLTAGGEVTDNAASGGGTLTVGGAGTTFSGAVQNGANDTASLNVDLASGTFDMTNGNLVIGSFTLTAGTFNAPDNGQNFTLSGNFTNSGGIFNANGGTVTLTGGTQTLSGSTQFNSFSDTTPGAQLDFTNGTTTTVDGTLTLTGTSGNLLTLRSTTTGSQWSINPASSSVSYVDVEDSNNTATSPIIAANSTDSGDNGNWIFSNGTSFSYDSPGNTNAQMFTLQEDGSGNIELLNPSNAVVWSNSDSGVTSFTFNGANNSPNALNLIYTSGSTALPATLTTIDFNGAASLTSQQALTITDGSFYLDVYTYTSSNGGNVSLDSIGINFTNLTQLANTGTAAFVSFELPSAATAAVNATLDDNGSGSPEITSTTSSFPTTTFTNPNNSLEVDSGGGADGTTIVTTAAFQPDFTASLTLDGFAATDTIDLNALNLSTTGSTLSVTGQINVEGTPITTSGGQTYNGPVLLFTNATVTSTGSGNITFDSTVDSPTNQSLNVNTAGITIFTDAIGDLDALGGLTTDANGSTQINGGVVDTLGGTQTYNDNVLLGQATTVLTGTVNFNAGLTLGATATTATSALQIDGDLNFTNTSKLTQTIAGSATSQYGNIAVSGNVSLGNAALSVNVSSFTPTEGEAFETIDNQGTQPVTGTFANLAEGAEFTSNSVPFRISYKGGTGVDVVLAAFPANITANPTNQAVYAGNAASFTASSTSATVIWQVSSDGGVTFSNLSNGGYYSGVTTTTLTINSAPFSFNNYQYRAMFGVGAGQTATTAATLTVVSQYASAAYQAAYGAYAYAYGAYVAGEGAYAYLTMNNAYSSYYYAYYSYYYNSIGNYSASQSAAYYAYYYGYLAAYYASVDYSATGNSDILAIYDYAYVAYYESYQTALGY